MNNYSYVQYYVVYQIEMDTGRNVMHLAVDNVER